jgi:hypothetical protein
MTAPAYLPLANGLAQSCISLARFFGPLFGGVIWSNSIADGPGVRPQALLRLGSMLIQLARVIISDSWSSLASLHWVWLTATRSVKTRITSTIASRLLFIVF